MTIGNRVRKLRDYFKLDGREFAQILGTNQSAISLIENDKQNIPVDLILKLREKWDISYKWLLNGKGEMFIVTSSTDAEIFESIFTWMKSLPDAERTWLSIEMRNRFPEYKDWLEQKGE